MLTRLLAGWFIFAPVAALAQTAGQGAILDENAPMRRYYRFTPNHVSPAVLKAEGEKLLGKTLYDRLKQNTEKWLETQGRNLSGADWRDHAVLAAPGARAFNPWLAAPPPEDWAAADFDDGGWVLLRTPFQGAPPPGITQPVLGQYDETVDLKLHQAFYRARFQVQDVKSAGALSLQVVYAGGARVFLNGQEIARGHLPKGNLTPDEPGDDYPAAAYGKAGEAQSRRTLGPVPLPAGQLRQGINVLAVEVRASNLHPIVLTNPTQPNWGGPTRPWPHARLFKLDLRGGATGVASVLVRPAGAQVWAEDVHNRTLSSDWLPVGEQPGAIRLTGARNGSYSAQVVVGTDKDLADVQVRCEPLQRAGGQERIGGPSIQVLPMAGYPLGEWSMKRLGDERGLGASFPDMQQLARYAAEPARGQTFLFDRISSVADQPISIPAGASRAFWLRVQVPQDAAVGTYQGKVEALSGGKTLGIIPVELEIVDWALPAPRAFRTLVGCEENPYAVARQYGVKLWSDEHFRLLEGSFRQLGRAGNQWLNVPVLARGEFGNGEDSMIRWVRKPDQGLSFDYAVLDRYLDLAVKHCGAPRVIQFVVMHGMKSALQPPAPPLVSVHDQATAKSSLLPVGDSAGPEARKAWTAFATALYAHMKARQLEKSMYWGAPWEQEAEPGLKTILAECVPGVFWTAGPHEMMSNGTFAKDEKFYRLVTDIRYHGGWPSFRDDQGWKSKTIHLLNPRVGGTAYALHTTSYPFAFRVMVDRALAMGRGGFSRVGADDWAATHYDGIALPKWVTGMPVLFLLWPGPTGAESSARFEALLEGIQETEARIFLEQAVDAGRLPAPLADKVRKTLAQHFDETNICQGNSLIHSIEQYDYGWLHRSRRLYRLAAEAASLAKPASP